MKILFWEQKPSLNGGLSIVICDRKWSKNSQQNHFTVNGKKT